MKIRNPTPLLILAAISGLSLGACDNADPGRNGDVKVVMQGLGSADNAVDVVLPIVVGVEFYYFFDVTGDAVLNDGKAYFTLNIHPGTDDALLPIHTVEFDLPFNEVDAQDGESGSGQKSQGIVEGPNEVLIKFKWNPNTPPMGDTNIDLEFSHAPRILVWSKIPGPGNVGAGEDVAIRARVAFYGDGLAETVTAQFYSAGSPVGVSATLVDLDGGVTDGVWDGTVTAVSGADTIRLTASDSEGDTISEVPYLVP